MGKIGIVTDSVSCIPSEWLSMYDIRVVPLRLTMDGRTFRDLVDITPEEFWRQMSGVDQFSAFPPSAEDFKAVYADLARDHDAVVCIVASRALSGVWDTAIEAKDLLKTDHLGVIVEVLDSKTAGGAEGFVVREAAKAAKENRTLGDIVKAANVMADKVKLLLVVGTLKYLMKSGRLPKTGMIGEWLQIKAILGMVDGTGRVKSLGRSRTKKRAVAKLAKLVAKYADTSRPLHVLVHYTDEISDGKALQDMVTARYDCEEIYTTPYTMSGVHGPVVAVAFYS